MAKNTVKSVVENQQQSELIYESKRDLNPFWSSSLFSDVYLKNDLPREYKAIWDNDEVGGYYDFYQGFINLCHDLEHESFHNWREADTVKNWIVPIMNLLGWENNSERHQNSYIDNTSFTITENTKKQVYRPDLIYFDKPQHKAYTQKEKEGDAKLREARDKKTGAKIVLEAKYWNRLSSLNEKVKSKEGDDSASSLGPELQTIKYMDIFNLDFSILSDGKTWKLYHKDLSEGINPRCFEFDLGNLMELALDLNRANNEQRFRQFSKYFYYFFCKTSFVLDEKSKNIPFAYEVLEYSKKYAGSIEEDLRKRFIVTMGIACNALKESCLSTKSTFELEQVRNVAESHIFNLLFVKSCEVRKVLPIQSSNYLRLSLHEVVEALTEMNFDPDKNWDDYLRDFRFGQTFGGKSFEYEGYEIFNRFINLYEIIHDGTAESKDFGFEISGFKESIFSKQEWKFAKTQKITNRDMIRIIFNLYFIESSFPQRKYQQIPYSYFSPRQLGSIYESFLEFRLEEAETDMIFVKGQWVPAILKSNHVKTLKLLDRNMVKKGQLFFSPDNEERKMTGSYYTPDYIVRYLVKEALSPLVEGKKSNDLLNIRLCDPAMGSGHFLSGALDYLVEAFRQKWSEENNDDCNESVFNTSRRILDKCLFGVDKNPRAVKLAKMSFWLLTAYPGVKLERLDDQFMSFDSLLDDKKWKELLAKHSGWDAIVGNPPYIRGKILEADYRKQLESKFVSATGIYDLYALFIEKSLSLLNHGGKLAFITPSKYAQLDFGKGLRSFIKERDFNLDVFVDFADNQVFDDATTYCALSVFGKGKDSVRYCKFPEKSEVKSIQKLLESCEYQTLSSDLLEIEPWNFSAKPTRIKKAGTKTVKLGDICDKIFQGLVLTPTESFPVRILGKFTLPLKEDKLYDVEQIKTGVKGQIEGKLLVPILKSSNIFKNNVEFSNYFAVFPYHKGDFSIMSPKVLKDQFSSGYKFLTSVKKPLIEREKGRWKDSNTWYEYSRVQNFDCHQKRKILVPGLAKEPRFCIDDGKFFIDQGSYGCILKKEYQHLEYFILACLNSDFTKQYIESVSPMLSGGYYNYQTKYLKDLELTIPSEKDVNNVTSLYKKFLVKPEDKLEEEINKLVSGY